MPITKELLAYLQDTSGLEQSALASFVKEDESFNEDEAPKVLAAARKAYADKLKKYAEEEVSKAGKTFDNGYKKAQGEVLTKYEEELCKDLGIDPVSGEKLREAIKAKLKGPASKELDKDTIEKSKFYLDSIEAVKKEWEAKLQESESKFTSFEAQVKQEKTFGQVWNAALPIIEESKPKFDHDNETVRNFQWKTIREGLLEGGRQFDIQDKRIVVLDKDGKLDKDEMGNPIDFNSLVLKVVNERVGTFKSEPRDSAGVKNGQKTTPQTGKWTKPVPKNDEELSKILADESYTFEEKKAAKDAYIASKKAA